MKPYNSKISLIENSRGVYCIDTIMGCESGLKENTKGCYGDCYAARIAKRYGHDFSKSILRNFEGQRHKRQILSQIDNIKMPFIRIGCSGDPSENWQHTFDIIKTLSRCNIEIIVITRHWNLLSDEQLNYCNKINICINTSISALDDNDLLDRCLTQYHRIKPYCKSILRIVSCSFNLNNEIGNQLAIIQKSLFSNESTIDTVFRPSKKNPLIEQGIINVKEEVFNGKKQVASKFNRKTFMANCSNCIEMCGQSIKTNYVYPNKRPLVKQLSIV